ncbi:MAG: nuclear transport factor 2 family protein [Pyrinomonadaceae bacterium]
MSATDPNDDATVELSRIQERLAAAWVAGDPSFHKQVLADDWSVIDATGRVRTKAEVLAESFGDPERKITLGKIDDIKVRTFGDWAVVTGRTHAAGEYRGEPFDVSLRFTDVFAQRDGKWQAVASHATLVND